MISPKYEGFRSGVAAQVGVQLREAFRGTDIDPSATVVLATDAVLIHRGAQQRGEAGGFACFERGKKGGVIGGDAGKGQAWLPVCAYSPIVERKVALRIVAGIVDQKKVGEVPVRGKALGNPG